MSNNKLAELAAKGMLTETGAIKSGANLTLDLIDSQTTDKITADDIRNDLNALHNVAVNTLREPARIGSVLRHVQLYRDNLTTEEFIQLNDAAEVLVKDLTQYSNDLTGIKADADALPWDSVDIMDLQLPSITVYERYHSWVESFVTVVMPVSAVLGGLINQAVTASQAKTSNPS